MPLKLAARRPSILTVLIDAADSMTDAADAAPLRVLTVGDGDLSYSLALQRAFGDRLKLTATVLPSSEELVATYTSAAACAAELMARGATVLYGVDATAVTQASVGQQDAVVFNHPHLGLADLQETVGHARRHGDQWSTRRQQQRTRRRSARPARQASHR